LLLTTNCLLSNWFLGLQTSIAFWSVFYPVLLCLVCLEWARTLFMELCTDHLVQKMCVCGTVCISIGLCTVSCCCLACAIVQSPRALQTKMTQHTGYRTGSNSDKIGIDVFSTRSQLERRQFLINNKFLYTSFL
jgi:hypothetical protein